MPGCATSLITQDVLENIEEMRENKIWMVEELTKLKKKYPNEFVAIYKKKIVGNNNDFKVLIRTLKAKHDNIDMIAIEFIVGEDYYLIL